ncbi:hypothetical protein [Nocardia sp. NPDC057030]|uniref:hypothetical protein n=1 Tax=unclassified Nocardia TaxID=2637762 RepID=UPI0036447A90
MIETWRDEFKVVYSEPIRPHSRSGPALSVVWPRPKIVEHYLGWKPSQAWAPSRNSVAHKVQVSRARAALCGLEPGLWVPERQLYRDAALAVASRWARPGGLASRMGGFDFDRQRGHVFDGRYRDSRDGWLSVEVELTVKWPTGTRLAATVRDTYQALPNGNGLLYLYGDEQVGNALNRIIVRLIAAGHLPKQPKIRLRSLHQVIATRTLELPPVEEAAS